MRLSIPSLMLALAGAAYAGKDTTSFAVLHFNTEPGNFSAAGQMDPVVFPDQKSPHVHGIMGGSNFGLTINGDQLKKSKCSNAKIKNDKSNYWVPTVWFQSPANDTFKQVPLDYMNVYYFFEATDDTIKPFPTGLKMVSGDALTRTAPATGALQLDPTKGKIQPVQWTCPTKNTVDHYPAGSDGKHGGLQDPQNSQSGAGFPVVDCDGANSPLRQDITFPSCYDPSKAVDDYKNNMVYATPVPNSNKVNCPKGFLHVPHLFYEVYYDTTLFSNAWTRDGKKQPFVLSDGDRTGFSSHGDFVAGWDDATLQAIIDTCDVGTHPINGGGNGMETCPNIIGGVNTNDDCPIHADYPIPAGEWLSALPGNNPITGWD
ncbi:hypothetical protein KJ359_008682 [Pestalotiopsis sp. 9143b]|nr:hypothetical protein KJ359_008682 [Pestalotiopsis sp. 9143b]